MKSRFKRRSFRSRLANVEPQPRFQVGDTAGEFVVIEYLGYSAIRPDILKVLTQEHHWYRVRCSCTNATVETHSQQQLIDIRRTRACDNCTSQLQEIQET